MNNSIAIKILFACLCAVAVFSGLWGFLTGSGAVPALVAAVVLLVAAQLLLFVMMSGRAKNNENPETLEAINKRIGRLEKNIKRLSKLRPISQPNEPIQQLAPMRAEPNHEPEQTATVTEREPVPVFSGPGYLDDRRLSLYLEPVTDILSKDTKFYRAELAFASERVGKIRISDMLGHIARNNHSADIDMKLFRRLGPVIDRLAEKGRATKVICPMSQYSFSNQEFLEDLTRYLKQYQELAKVLVIEITQENLADLSQDGMAGLAFLAQIGATFCLGGAGLESPDLGSLASLGFRYLDLDYHENVERYGLQAFGTNGAATKLKRDAGKVGIALIGSGFIRKSQCDAVNDIVEFGRGPVFSPPRLVRSDFATPIATPIATPVATATSKDKAA